jgi:hypothetical protein
MIRSAAYRHPSRGGQRQFRRGTLTRLFAGRFALVAMLLYALAPFALPERAAAQPLVEICTAHGIVTVPLPGADGPAEAPATPGMTDCPACALSAHGSVHAKIVPPPAIALPLRAAGALILRAPRSAERLTGVAVSTRRAHAPPLSV